MIPGGGTAKLMPLPCGAAVIASLRQAVAIHPLGCGHEGACCGEERRPGSKPEQAVTQVSHHSAKTKTVGIGFHPE